MRNQAVVWALKETVYQTVNWAMYEALHQAAKRGDVGRCAAVYQAVYWGLDRIVCEAIAARSAMAEREALPHPGFVLYLAGVGR